MAAEGHAILSASGSKRWMACTPSARLEESFEDVESEYAREGTAAHALAEHKLRKYLKLRSKRPVSDYETDEMNDYTDEYVSYCVEQIEAARQQCKDPIIQVEQHLDFSCYVPDGFGTGDFLLVADGELHIVDLKYGKGVAVYADHNPQMMLYALGALNLFDCLYDIQNITMTIHQPRLESVSSWSITVEELTKWATEELKSKADLAIKGEGEFHAGSWCRFCKARNTCRERADSFLELAKMEFQPSALLSEEEIAEVLAKADELSKWATDVFAYAQEEAITHGKAWNGFKLVEGRSNRKYADETKVVQAAKAAGYTDIYKQSLIGISEMEKLMGKKEFSEVLGALVYKPQGKISLVPATDKRQPITIATAQSDFMED